MDDLQEYSNKLLAGCTDKKVVYHVHLEREPVIDLYRTSDVFVCPSKSETWSIVAHEAAASAMPIISTDVGIYREIAGSVIVHSVEEMKEAMPRVQEQELATSVVTKTTSLPSAHMKIEKITVESLFSRTSQRFLARSICQEKRL